MNSNAAVSSIYLPPFFCYYLGFHSFGTTAAHTLSCANHDQSTGGAVRGNAMGSVMIESCEMFHNTAATVR